MGTADRPKAEARRRRWLLLGVATLSGLAIAWLDSRPGWDDTGISAALVFMAAGGFTAVDPGRAWLWALAVGVWIPVIGIGASNNYGSLLALAIAFAGAGSGWLIVQGLRLFARQGSA